MIPLVLWNESFVQSRLEPESADLSASVARNASNNKQTVLEFRP